MRRTTVVFSVLASFGIAGALWAAESADLRPKFKVDQVQYYRNSTDQTMKVSVQPQPMKMDMEIGMRLRADKVRDDGGADVELTYVYLKMEGGPPAMPMNLDTRKEEDPATGGNPMLSGLRNVVDKSVMLKISPEGQVEEVSGIKELVSSLGPSGAMLGSVFSEESFKALPMFPTGGAPKPAEVGADWDHLTAFPIPGGGGAKIALTTQYKLEKLDAADKKAEITSTASAKMDTPEGAPPMITMDKGTGAGKIVWDYAAGSLIKSVNNMEMTMKAGMGGDASASRTIEQKVVTTVERVSLEDLSLPAKPADEAAEPKGEKAPEGKKDSGGEPKDKPKENGQG